MPLARDLWEFLEVKSNLSHWIGYRIKQYGFIENKEFWRNFAKIPGRGRPTVEYNLTWNMAKELGMIENSDQGRRAQLYFIEIDQAKRTVNARDLWAFLGSKRNYSDWIRYRIQQYGFIENTDFTTILCKNGGRGRPTQEHHLRLGRAIRMAVKPPCS
jgi:phage anti-repressor protein